MLGRDRGDERLDAVDLAVFVRTMGATARLVPSVVEAFADVDFVAALHVGDRTAALPRRRPERQRVEDRLAYLRAADLLGVQSIDRALVGRQVAMALVCTSWHPPPFHDLSG